jgi:HEAT repeat protein
MRPALLVVATLLALAACGTPMSPDQAIAELRSPDAAVRRTAADALRTGEGVTPAAVPALLSALASEQNAEARGAMLITLGRSGAPEAKAPIDQAVQAASDKYTQRWSGRALHYWLIKTGQMAEKAPLPDGWPFGQPGFPPIVRD